MTRIKGLFGVVDSCFLSNKVISVECFLTRVDILILISNLIISLSHEE